MFTTSPHFFPKIVPQNLESIMSGRNFHKKISFCRTDEMWKIVICNLCMQNTNQGLIVWCIWCNFIAGYADKCHLLIKMKYKETQDFFFNFSEYYDFYSNIIVIIIFFSIKWVSVCIIFFSSSNIDYSDCYFLSFLLHFRFFIINRLCV